VFCFSRRGESAGAMIETACRGHYFENSRKFMIIR
jgi:hypothetical protein